MKIVGITSTALLALLVAIVAPAYALHEQQGEKQDHPDKSQAAQHEQARPEQQHTQQQQGQNKQQHAQEQHRVEQTAWQQHRTGSWQSDHRTWQQRGGYNGYRIPDNRFHGYFGPDRAFRIEGLPFLVVGGYPRFQYGGYWFSLVDPWPGHWAPSHPHPWPGSDWSGRVSPAWRRISAHRDGSDHRSEGITLR